MINEPIFKGVVTGLLLSQCLLGPCLLIQSAVAAEVYVNLSYQDEITISSESNSAEDISILDYADVSHHSPTIPFTKKTHASKSLSIAAKYKSTSKLPYHQEVMLAAHITALEPALIHAVIAVESSHNPKARSNKGAFGLMQLMPTTAQKFATSAGDSPSKNILAGSKYLRELLNEFDNNLPLALAAYNAGPNAIKKYQGKIPPYAETQRYVPKVIAHFQQFSKQTYIPHSASTKL